eukprot:TRINITY_DN10819_c0_g1_i7.p1 TRINITY_DN10819_c0_g1~~TRINITY_DN10819_c0_g1_i7.p1  ORF type:complete len:104 (+),score=11.56 TRINITY_DN10819_c0_g1_i7:81-392(+)
MSTPKLPRLASISRQSSSGSTVEQGLDRVEKLDKKLKKIAAKEKQVKQQRAQPAESDAKDTFFLTQIDADKQKSPTDAGAAGVSLAVFRLSFFSAILSLYCGR